MMELEEIVEVKVASKPVLPGVQAIRAHELTHQPFRNWCRHCVTGKSDDAKHEGTSTERTYPVVAIDYTYMGKRIENSDLVFVVHGDKSESIMACAVSSKGGSP